MPEWSENTRLLAGGKTLDARCLGPKPKDAPTLVLLHEGLGSARLWRDFPDRLVEATGHGCLAYSRAGYGDSESITLPRPLDYMSREAPVLKDVLDAFAIQRAVLVGHSDGGSIAAIYAGSVFDPRVRGLVLMAPHFFTEAEGLAQIEQARQAFEIGTLREKLARHHDDVDAAFRGWCDAWLDPGFRDWDVTDAIDHIRVPVLAIQGQGDSYGTLAQIEVVSERCYAPVETRILEKCGHAPFIDQPDAVLAEVAQFCQRLTRIEATA